jgi:hypothetical protein
MFFAPCFANEGDAKPNPDHQGNTGPEVDPKIEIRGVVVKPKERKYIEGIRRIHIKLSSRRKQVNQIDKTKPREKQSGTRVPTHLYDSPRSMCMYILFAHDYLTIIRVTKQIGRDCPLRSSFGSLKGGIFSPMWNSWRRHPDIMSW